MASVHLATGKACVVAFNAGNLMDVCSQVRTTYPDNEIVVCADDDHMTKGNQGLTKAREAALKIGAGLAVQTLRDPRKWRNGLQRPSSGKGLDAVKTAVDMNRLSPQDQ